MSEKPEPPLAWETAVTVENYLSVANALNDLANWIAVARGVARDLEDKADCYPALLEQLKTAGVCFSFDDSWGEAEDEGLQYLHKAITANLKGAAGAVGLKLRGMA